MSHMNEVEKDTCQSPRIVGILNVTPDSFFDGGRYQDTDAAVEHALRLVAAGADVLDIGGESSRPFSQPVSQDEELRRVVPVIQKLQSRVSLPLSIDTYKPVVARAALRAGASWINDITGFEDPEMAALLAESGATGIVMHMQGTPQTMQHNPHYPNGVVAMICSWMEEKVAQLLRLGVKPEQIVLDPGIGFGKSVEDCLNILRHLDKFKKIGFPILIGASRKSFLKKIVKKEVSALLSASIAVHTMALTAQVDLIRVHDVAEHRDMVAILKALTK